MGRLSLPPPQLVVQKTRRPPLCSPWLRRDGRGPPLSRRPRDSAVLDPFHRDIRVASYSATFLTTVVGLAREYPCLHTM